MSNFRRWGRALLGSDVYGQVLSTEQQKAALQYLTTLIHAALFTDHTVLKEILVEKRMRTEAFSRKAGLKRDRFWQLRELPHLQKEASGPTGAPLARENNTLYKRWLHGATRYLRKTQKGYMPPTRNRYDKHCALDLERRRPRFPAAGRRRRSYDSLLHSFAKKTSPSRFRRASSLKFQPIYPSLSDDAHRDQLTLALGRALCQRRSLAHKLNRTAYLSVS